MKRLALFIAVLLSCSVAHAACGVGAQGFNGSFRFGGTFGTPTCGSNFQFARPVFQQPIARPVFQQPIVRPALSNRQLLLLQAERAGVASRFEARFLNGLSLSDELELLRRLRLRY